MIIDELVVKLGLDPKQFNDAQRQFLSDFKKTQDQAKRSADAVENQGKRLGDIFTGIKRQALGLLTVFLGGRGILEFVSHVTTLDASTGRLAKTVNLSTEELSIWQGVFSQVGGSAESANAAIHGISSSINEGLITGEVPAFGRYIGGIIDQTTHKAKTAVQVLRQLADLTRGMDPAVATAFLSRTVPGINQDAINLILKGSDAIDKYYQSAKAAGSATKESSDAAEKYQENMANLDRTATSLGRTLLNMVSPRLSEAMGNLALILQGKSAPAQASGPAHPLAPWNARDIPIKAGAGSTSPATAEALKVLSVISEIKQVTALNDAFHSLRGGDHSKGRAIDLTINDPSQSASTAQAIRERLAGAGISARVRDEYANPSAGATGGHIHVSIGNINLPGVKDADGFAKELPAVVKRSSFASSFNQGPQ